MRHLLKNLIRRFDGSWIITEPAFVDLSDQVVHDAGCNVLLAWNHSEYRHCRVRETKHLHWTVNDSPDEWPNHFCGTCVKHEQSQTPV